MATEKYIVGNWKSYKGTKEAIDWNLVFENGVKGKDLTGKRVIVCPSFTILHLVNDVIQSYKEDLPIEVGAQDVSAYGEGKFTGAINAKQLKEFVDWVIIGHSERRRVFGESDDEILTKKVMEAKSAGLKVVYCVESENISVPGGVDIVAYEPPGAIGTGKPDTPENANSVAKAIKEKNPRVKIVIYGGSVDPSNIVSFISQPDLDGVLPGAASLDAEKFLQLVLANPK